MSRGFITFEGIDGAGKSTHLDAVEAYLTRRGHDVVRTREPGGTALAEALRRLVLNDAMDALTEVLLVFAARRDHLGKVIRPALERGATVLSDRFTDATFAYQGAGRGFDAGKLKRLEEWVHGGLQPDLTFWFDLDPAQALRRIAGERVADRFETESLAFFERVRGGYRARHDAEPERFVRIDAAVDPAEVERQVLGVLETRGW